MPGKAFIVLVVATLLVGSVYGYMSAVHNRNPYYEPRFVEDSYGGYRWQPSPLWLPSYILCNLSAGIAHTKSGYLFRSEADRAAYTLCSVAMGLIPGIALIVAGLFRVKLAAKRLNSVEGTKEQGTLIP